MKGSLARGKGGGGKARARVLAALCHPPAALAWRHRTQLILKWSESVCTRSANTCTMPLLRPAPVATVIGTQCNHPSSRDEFVLFFFILPVENLILLTAAHYSSAFVAGNRRCGKPNCCLLNVCSAKSKRMSIVGHFICAFGVFEFFRARQACLCRAFVVALTPPCAGSQRPHK
jgi:hypothetical protein